MVNALIYLYLSISFVTGSPQFMPYKVLLVLGFTTAFKNVS